MSTTKALRLTGPSCKYQARFVLCNHVRLGWRPLSTTLARLGARQLFPHHHFIPPQFPEEPIGYTAKDGFGFYQGGPGSTLGPSGRYELQAKLGCGITSTVWLAKDREASTDDKRHVTIKILAGYATKFNKDSIILRESDIVKLLAEGAPRLTDYSGEHIARVSDHFFQPGVEKCDGEHLCLVTDFYPNDLQSVQYTLGRKPFPVPVVKRALNHLAKGLAELHAHGIAHTGVYLIILRLLNEC